MISGARHEHRGWLHDLDPRSKLAFGAAGVAAVFALPPAGLIAVLALAVALLLSSRVGVQRVRTIGTSLIPLIVLILLTWPLYNPIGSDVLLAWGIVRVTRDGVLGAVAIGLKIVALIYVLSLIVATTDQARMVRAMVKLGLPYALGLMLGMSMRFIPTLYGLYHTVTEAQSARGWNPPAGNPVARARGYLPVLVTLLIGAIRLSDQTAMALTARGFDAAKPRTWYREVRFGRGDWFVLVVSVLVAAGVVWWRSVP